VEARENKRFLDKLESEVRATGAHMELLRKRMAKQVDR